TPLSGWAAAIRRAARFVCLACADIVAGAFPLLQSALQLHCGAARQRWRAGATGQAGARPMGPSGRRRPAGPGAAPARGARRSHVGSAAPHHNCAGLRHRVTRRAGASTREIAGKPGRTRKTLVWHDACEASTGRVNGDVPGSNEY
ncbi:hypothetical protein, partial [Burkholderia gladioli]|uniref:hypothetical protein n=1 Tax=Burkholderia gladioli TaxID=28095 RepID=UPI003F68B4EB